MKPIERTIGILFREFPNHVHGFVQRTTFLQVEGEVCGQPTVPSANEGIVFISELFLVFFRDVVSDVLLPCLLEIPVRFKLVETLRLNLPRLHFQRARPNLSGGESI